MENPVVEYYRSLCAFVLTKNTDDPTERERLRRVLPSLAESAQTSWYRTRNYLGSLLVCIGQKVKETETVSQDRTTQRDVIVYFVRRLADAAEKDLSAIQDNGEAAAVFAELKKAIFRG